MPGDDLRQLDWNVYARHDHPFIKLREKEDDLAVYLLVDGSKSMDWGIDDENKLIDLGVRGVLFPSIENIETITFTKERKKNE